MTLRDDLAALFDAERTVRSIHVRLADEATDALLSAITPEVKSALENDDEEESALRLVRLAHLLGDMEGEKPVDLLIDILDGDSVEARVVAGEALEGIAFDRFKEVALGIERALARLPGDSVALQELPFLLAEVGEPGCTKLLGRFLQHADADVVASGIEALVELGDPAAIPMLAKLARDPRQVQLEEEEGEGERVGLGELAHEASELLADMIESAQPTAPNAGKGKPGAGKPRR